MSMRRVLSVSRSPSGRLTFACLLLAVIACFGAVAFVGTGAAAVPVGQYDHGNGTDDEPPRLANGSKVNETAINVTIADNHDVNESTIEPEHFLLSRGEVENISTTENGSNATVLLRLNRRLNTDEVTIVLQSNASITDTAGNPVNTDGFVTVDGMDGVPPGLQSFNVTNATGKPATMDLETTEELGGLTVAVSGTTTEYVDISAFETNGSVREYVGTYRPSEDGQLTVTLVNISDGAGNVRETDESRSILVDLTGPEADAAIDLARSSNRTITFDGSGSADANGVSSYAWNFGDGTAATGKRVTHTFAPGNYTVELTATDPYGNSGTDTVTLNFSDGPGQAPTPNNTQPDEQVDTGLNVVVDRPAGNVSTEAVVGVENAPGGQPVTVGRFGDAGTPLARSGAVTLDGLSVTLATNRSFDLGLSMTGPEAVGDAANATNSAPLAGLTVVNTLSDEDVQNATVQFSVPSTRLLEVTDDPQDVSLYRYHDGNWQRLQTTPYSSDNTTRRFRASTPGFSRFAVLVKQEPALSVTDATLETPEVAVGENFSVTATVTNPGSEQVTYVAGLSVDGTVETTESVSISAGSNASVTLSASRSTAGTYALSVNGTSAGEVTVTNATKSGNNETADDAATGKNGTKAGQFFVIDASLNTTQVSTGEPFAVNVTVKNLGNKSGQFTAGIQANNSTVYTTVTKPIPPSESRQVRVQYFFEKAGTYAVAVNGTKAGTLQVGNQSSGGSGGGGGGIVGTVLGLVPVGIIRPLVMFVVLPGVVIFGLLKGLAYYLGY